MGLDQFASAGIRRNNGEFIKSYELQVWRKHNRLQGWMENLWRERGNEEVFNCQNLYLTADDIDALDEVINNHDLPETAGFFYGSDSYADYEEYDKPKDMDFIDGARKAISEGLEVVYSCWW